MENGSWAVPSPLSWTIRIFYLYTHISEEMAYLDPQMPITWNVTGEIHQNGYEILPGTQVGKKGAFMGFKPSLNMHIFSKNYKF